MSETGSKRAVAEAKFTEDRVGVSKVGGRSIHQYWMLLGPHFRDVFLAPQRRSDDGGVSWTWREPAEKKVLTAADFAAVRSRLERAKESFNANPVNPLLSETRSGGMSSQEVIDQVAARVKAMADGLSAKPDAVLAEYVCRTENGVMVHSWGLATAAKVAYPDASDSGVAGVVLVAGKGSVGNDLVIENIKGLRVARTLSGENGAFDFPKLKPGKYRIRVVSGNGRFRKEGVTFEVTEGETARVEISSEEETAGEGEKTDTPATPGEAASSAPAARKTRRVLVPVVAIAALGVGVFLYWHWHDKNPGQKDQTAAADRISRMAPETFGEDRPAGKAVGNAPVREGAGLGAFADGAGAASGAAAPAASVSMPNQKQEGTFEPVRSAKGPRIEISGTIQENTSAGGGMDAARAAPEAELGTANDVAAQYNRGGVESGRTSAAGESGATELSSGASGAAAGERKDKAAAIPRSTGGLPPREKGTGAGAPRSPGGLPGETKGGAGEPEHLLPGEKTGGTGSNDPSGGSTKGQPAGASGAPVQSGTGDETAAGEEAVASGSGPSPSVDVADKTERTHPADRPKKATAGKSSSSPEESANNGQATKDVNPPEHGEPPPGDTAQSQAAKGKAPAPRNTPAAAGDSGANDELSERINGGQEPDKKDGMPSPLRKGEANEGKTLKAAQSPSKESEAKTARGKVPGDTGASQGGSASVKNGDNGNKNQEKEVKPELKKDGQIDPDAAKGQNLDAKDDGEARRKTSNPGGIFIGKNLQPVGTVGFQGWVMRVGRDSIVSTVPVPDGENDSLELLRRQVLDEQKRKCSETLAQPELISGFAVKFVAGAKPKALKWLSGQVAGIVTRVENGRAEMEWMFASAPHDCVLSLGWADGTEAMRVTFGSDGSASVALLPELRASLWLAACYAPAEAEAGPTRYTWRVVRGPLASSAWSSDGTWMDRTGCRLDVVLNGSTPADTVIALLDRDTGWELLTRLK